MAKTPAKKAETLPATTAFDTMGGAGLENVTASDVIIPRLAILQDLSPQVKKNKPEHIDGAEAGMICDVSTGDLMPSPMEVLPVHFVKQYLEWAPRNSGKGLQGIHDSDACLIGTTPNEKGVPINAAGNLIIETSQFYVINLSADNRLSFIPMSSTQHKHGRKWLSMAKQEKVTRADGSKYTPPFFYRTYQLGVSTESNAEGEWYGWSIARGDKIQDRPDFEELFATAKQFYEDLMAGVAKGDMSHEEEARGGRKADMSQAEANMAAM